MRKTVIREPKQQRSKAKMQTIIRAGYQLFCTKGYYKTNTTEIAQEAGVAMGVVYNYFRDKKDILLAVVKLYLSSLSEQLLPILSVPVKPEELPSMIERLIDVSVASHTMNAEAHDEFFALALLEKEILNLFTDFQNSVQAKLCLLFENAGFPQAHLQGKISICFGLVEQLSHEAVRKQPSQEEWTVQKALAVRAIMAVMEATL